MLWATPRSSHIRYLELALSPGLYGTPIHRCVVVSKSLFLADLSFPEHKLG